MSIQISARPNRDIMGSGVQDRDAACMCETGSPSTRGGRRKPSGATGNGESRT